MAGLVYHKMFTPKDIAQLGEWQTTYTATETRLNVAKDSDDANERMVKLPLMQNPDPNLFQSGDDITVIVRLGHQLKVYNNSDPLFILISDGARAAVGFRIAANEKLKGVEGIPERFLTVTRTSGDDNDTTALSATDYPDEFLMSFKPEQYWGTIFCTHGNGTKQCVGYGKKPELSQGVYLEIYRDKPAEEYVLNYVEVSIFSAGSKTASATTPIQSASGRQATSQAQNFDEKVKQRQVIMHQLKDFKGLQDDGIITEEEFSKQKEQLLTALLSVY